MLTLSAFFLYHSVFFSLTLQRNAPVAAVIYSHAPLFARTDAALILIQAPVIQIIKIDASDQITSVAARMRIRLHDVLKACLQHLQFGHWAQIFKFMPEFRPFTFFCHSYLHAKAPDEKDPRGASPLSKFSILSPGLKALQYINLDWNISHQRYRLFFCITWRYWSIIPFSLTVLIVFLSSMTYWFLFPFSLTVSIIFSFSVYLGKYYRLCQNNTSHSTTSWGWYTSLYFILIWFWLAAF